MRIVSVTVLALFGCATGSVDESFDPSGEQPTISGKMDAPQACGDHGEVCAPNLCGAKFSSVDNNWIETCATQDDTASAFVRFSTTGAVTATFDSRETPYTPVTVVNDQLEHALHYGCGVTAESTTGLSGPEEGVIAYFAEFDLASWKPSVPSRRGRVLWLRVSGATFPPGVYQGVASFVDYRDPAANEYGGIGMSDHLCTVKASTDSSGAVSGTFTCHDVFENDGDGALGLTGEFKCPKNTLANGVWTKR
jgi:hypothetical protein